MKISIEKIYEDFRTSYENKPDFIIDFYIKHSISFNNIKAFTDKKELRLFIEMTWQYLNAVYHKGRFNEAIDYAIIILPLIDNEIARLDATELKDEWYYGILLSKGMALYRLRDYKTSTSIFKQLSATDPKNDNYKDWLNYSTYGQRLWLVNTLNIVFGLLIVVEIFFKEYIESFGIRMSLLGVGLIGLFANWSYEYYVKRNFRKTTTK